MNQTAGLSSKGGKGGVTQSPLTGGQTAGIDNWASNKGVNGEGGGGPHGTFCVGPSNSTQDFPPTISKLTPLALSEEVLTNTPPMQMIQQNQLTLVPVVGNAEDHNLGVVFQKLGMKRAL